jgi:peptide/nickel transport system substrate-binding protein
MRRVRLWLAIGLALAGCAKAAQDKPKQGAEGPPPPVPVATPHPGGHLVLPSVEPRDFNPAVQTRFDRATPLVFDGLVGLDANLKVVPVLAESWELSADGKVITFKLRNGVRWHDGKPFTSKDVAFTYEVVKRSERPTVWKAYLAGVKTVGTPDDRTVVVVYDAPYGPALSTWTIGIIPSHAYGDDAAKAATTDSASAIGTGPFKFGRWEPGQRIVLERFNDYWAGAPYLESVELRLNLSPPQQLEMLSKGELDFVEISDVAMWSREVHARDFRKRFEVQDEVESRFRMIAWNEQRSVFENPKVRIAMSHALDRQRIVEDVLIGQAQLLSAPFFPTMYGADPSIPPYPFDLSIASKLLDEAGYPAKNDKRFALELIAPASQRSESEDEMLAIFRHDLESIGIDLKVNYLDTGSFFDAIVLREFDAALLGWLPDVADPDPYVLLHSTQINAGANYAGYANNRVDELLEEARSHSSRDVRKALYHKIHRLLHDEEPYTMLYAPYGHYAWNRRIRGVNPRDIGTMPRHPGVARWWAARPDEAVEADEPAL